MNSLLIETARSCGPTFQLLQGDFTAETTEAIVNPVNECLKHGTGVARAISRGGVPNIQTESDDWVWKHGCVSHAKPDWTSGGRLPCRYVIHAVSPVGAVPGSDEDAKLGAAITGCLRVADKLCLESDSGIKVIRLVLYGASPEDMFQKAWHDHFDA